MKKRLLLGAALLGAMFTSQAQLSENFDGATFPPTGWTVESLNAFTWAHLTGANAMNGTGSANVQYDSTAPTTDQEEHLISPEILLSGMPVLSFNVSLSAYWSIGPGNAEEGYDNYDAIVSITTDGGATWTDIWDETELGAFASFTPYAVSLPLIEYVGEQVQIRFSYVGNDGAQLVIDDVSVVACGTPTGFVYAEPDPTPTSVSFGWTAAPGLPEGYELEYGPAGFLQGSGTTIYPTTNIASIEGLTAATDYAFYIRTNCGGGNYSEWVGPITFTSEYEPATPPYAYGFETANGGGWSSLRVDPVGSAWTVDATTDDIPSYEGESLATAGANGGISNAWLFSRGINLTANSTVNVTYFMRKFTLAGVGNINNVEVTYGTDNTADAQTNVLATFEDYSDEEYIQQSHTFTAPSTGVYYFGFNYTAPAHVQTDFGLIGIDNFEVTQTLSSNESLASQLSVFPNPATNIINVINNKNILVDGIQIVDLNGRTVKSAKFDGATEAQVNISDLANGVYMMTVSSDKGTMTQKIVKN